MILGIVLIGAGVASGVWGGLGAIHAHRTQRPRDMDRACEWLVVAACVTFIGGMLVFAS